MAKATTNRQKWNRERACVLQLSPGVYLCKLRKHYADETKDIEKASHLTEAQAKAFLDSYMGGGYPIIIYR